MDVNKDEAIRSLKIAREHFKSGNTSNALKFARKSFSLFPSTDANDLIKTCQSEAPTSPLSDDSAMGRSSSASSKATAANLRNRDVKSTPERGYTLEQVEAVKRIKACGNDYYKVLGVDRKCVDIEIKKSYKKLALQFHPDKNAAPGADEAFKMISKSFTILSDKQKRAIFDAGGMDPEQRSAGGSAGFGGMRGYNGGFQGEEINPEELFNMFFGGDAFGGGGFQSATFVGPRFNARTFRPASHGGRQQSQSTPFMSFLQLLPLLLIVLISFTSSIFNQEASPAYSLRPKPAFTTVRQTPRNNIPYYVNPAQFSAIENNRHKLSEFEKLVESEYIQMLRRQCQHEFEVRQQHINRAKGLFGIGADLQRLEELGKMKMESCEKFNQLAHSL